MDKEESLDKYRASQRKYWQSEKGKETLRRYIDSEKGKASLKRYKQSEKGKAADLRYRLSNKGMQRLTLEKAAAALSKFLKANPGKTVEDFWEMFVVEKSDGE